MLLVYQLIGDDITKTEAVLDMPLVMCLDYITYNILKNEETARKNK